MRDYPSERPKRKGYVRLCTVPKRLISLNCGTIQSRRGFGTLLGSFGTGYDIFQDSAKNGHIWDDFTGN